MALNNALCTIKPTLIDSNHAELNYHPLMISLDKYSGSCNSAYDNSTK